MTFERRHLWPGIAAAASLLVLSPAAKAFGDEGHQVVALIAEHYLTPDVRHKVFAMLAADTSGLTAARDIASEATWADRFRDSDRNTTRQRFLQTRQWHFVDVEIASPDPAAACFGHPPLPQGVAASAGPAEACVVDKIVQFEHELAAPATPKAERLLALQFVLHFVGDLHQPLHASDAHDQGGNAKQVRMPGRAAGSLHHHWDTAYGKLPPPQHGVRPLSKAYVKGATRLVAQQLSKAGVRLAALLNRSLGAASPSAAP